MELIKVLRQTCPESSTPVGQLLLLVVPQVVTKIAPPLPKGRLLWWSYVMNTCYRLMHIFMHINLITDTAESTEKNNVACPMVFTYLLYAVMPSLIRKRMRYRLHLLNSSNDLLTSLTPDWTKCILPENITFPIHQDLKNGNEQNQKFCK